jgi:hypothetical protein
MILYFCTPFMFLAAMTSLANPQSRNSTELESLWKDLGTDDPMKAHKAITALVAKADQTVPFLQKRLQPVPRPDSSRLARLIRDLDNKEFMVRESATHELEHRGEPAEAALRQALGARPSPEVRRRIERILETHKRERLHPPPEQQRLTRAVEVLEQIGNPAARRLLEALSQGAPEASFTLDAQGALHRLSQRTTPTPE